jgi:hypothetical protein
VYHTVLKLEQASHQTNVTATLIEYSTWQNLPGDCSQVGSRSHNTVLTLVHEEIPTIALINC